MKKWIVVFLCLVVSTPVWASAAKPSPSDDSVSPAAAADDAFRLREPSDLFLEGGKDSAQNAFGSVNVDLGLENGDLLFFNASASRDKDPTTEQTSTVHGFGLGYTFDPDDLLSFTPSFQNWGARSDLVSNSLLFDVSWNPKDWTLGLQPEIKTLTWATTLPGQEKVRTTMGGLNFHIDYFGVKHFDFQLFGGGWNTGRQRFQNFLYSGYITDSAQALESGLIKNYGGLGVTYHLFQWTLGVNAQSTTYIVDDIKAKSWSGSAKYDVTKAWSLGYIYTHIDTDGNPSTSSNALRLGYTW
jgi:hypothetical protein